MKDTVKVRSVRDGREKLVSSRKASALVAMGRYEAVVPTPVAKPEKPKRAPRPRTRKAEDE